MLVAVSIPIFTSQLEKSRESTDMANIRAAKAAAVSAYLTQDTLLYDEGVWKGSSGTGDISLVYDANAGVLTDSATGIKGYGKGTTTMTQGNTAAGTQLMDIGGGTSTAPGAYKDNTDAAGKLLHLIVSNDGTVKAYWA